MQRMFKRLPFTERIVRGAVSAGVEFIVVLMPLSFSRFPGVVRAVERRNLRFLASQVNDPETRRKLTPDYGLGCRRRSVSNDYLRTFNRENVELISDPIARITPTDLRPLRLDRRLLARAGADGLR